jgi:hypothetical protein
MRLRAEAGSFAVKRLLPSASGGIAIAATAALFV